MSQRVVRIVSSCFLLALMTASAGAQEAYPGQATELAKAAQNPVSGLLSVPFQFNFMTGGDLGDRTSYTLLLQPIIPMAIGSGWNVIARAIVPYNSVPTSGVRHGGFGDLQLQLYASPSATTEVTWGIGPMLSFPTATDDAARTGAWGVGPAAVAIRQHGAFVLGGMLTHLWTFSDYENDRPNISRLTFQPVLNYNFGRGWAVNFAPIMTGDWTASDGHQLTIPLGLGFSRVTVVGRQPISLGAEYYRNIARARGVGMDHLKLHVSFLFPAAS
jgi:hypothetical protein